MGVRFFLRYSTFFGQTVVLALRKSGGDISYHELQYQDQQFWSLTLSDEHLADRASLTYHYIIREQGRDLHHDAWAGRAIPEARAGMASVVYDEWMSVPADERVFQSRAFSKVLLKKDKRGRKSPCSKPTHHIRLMTSRLPEGKLVCLLGSGKTLGHWANTHPVLMHFNGSIWSTCLDFSRETDEVEFKFALYDQLTGKVEGFEAVPNRRLPRNMLAGSVTGMNLCADFTRQAWKGAGVNIQMSALRSETSWGVGDFTDIRLLADWSSACGLKMIQLLPVNDTSVHFDHRDSYPYSAISAFALHPIFLNVQELASSYDLLLDPDDQQEAARLNALPTLDYEAVYRLKIQTARRVFDRHKTEFRKELSYRRFFAANRDWLLPYAVFCHLRDRFGTADVSHWQEWSVYDADAVAALAESKNKEAEPILFHYFLQYHLFRQLSDAVSYCHGYGIIMKGDLPIGVGRHSVETWMHPGLFHMDQQAGAPPDAFTVKGQNWSFPTYNWEAMKADGYAWWRRRLSHMSRHFDAIRVDHVLGFFRIWSVPMHAIEGIFGVFKPCLPVYADEWRKAGLAFDEARLCEPYYNEQILQDQFGADAETVKHHFFPQGVWRSDLRTQRAVDRYCAEQGLSAAVRQGLFDLLAEVILFRDEEIPGAYHFRISIQDTRSFRALSHDQQQILEQAYVDYFYRRQNALWYEVALEKLDAIGQSSDMMICAEDLGMVPDMVEGVLKSREMLALQVQRMPKRSEDQFSHPSHAPYLSVVTPSTHDMSTLRQWWEEDGHVTQQFFNHQLGHAGKAPYFCEPWICRDIIRQHLQSPAMWSVFLLQDLMAMTEATRRLQPSEERINNPADPHHYWNYRMHLTLEALNRHTELSADLRALIVESTRHR